MILKPSPPDLISKVNRIMQVGIGIVSISEPDEAAIATSWGGHHAGGDLEKQVHALADLHHSGTQDDHQAVTGSFGTEQAAKACSLPFKLLVGDVFLRHEASALGEDVNGSIIQF